MNDQILSRLITETSPSDRQRSTFAWTSPGLNPTRRIAIIGTYAPRKCGIATFTKDIVDKLREYHPGTAIDVYVLDEPGNRHDYDGVAGVIDVEDHLSCVQAAMAINASGVDAVWIQHEYGIYGGKDGALVCDLVDRLAAPIILTPHTVLQNASSSQDRILSYLVERASRIMVMSRHARDLLVSRYHASAKVLEIIEHGAPDRPFGRQEQFKQILGLSDRPVLTTFGLIGPGKGLERMIEAMPAILDRHPDAVYRIVGATHPSLVAKDGESYRDRLVALAQDLGVTEAVHWENRFLEIDELLDQLEACDIYVTPYPGMQQSTSGTLSYAVALGKAVVSTPYLHARELLANDHGRLVEPDCSVALAEAIITLLDNPADMAALQHRAYAKGRHTIWPKFAEAAAKLIDKAVADGPEPATLAAAPDIGGVIAMSDSTGMLQHSIGIVPDRRHGYCLDDNARALMLMNVAEGLSLEQRMRWSMTYASFVQHAWNDDIGLFRNFMSFDRSWCEECGSEDANGRAFWAIGQTIARTPLREIREWATMWHDRVCPGMDRLQSPRAVAFIMLGATARLGVDPGHAGSRSLLEKGANLLCRILDATRRPDWLWFEVVLGYDNPRLCQALIEAGMVLDRPEWTRIGLDTLGWIADTQSAATGHFRAIGSETFGREGAVLPFDQQPLEAQASIEACASAYAASGDPRWVDHAERAWRWFFGANDRGVVLGDIATGRCRDGITPRGANENCGAESILAFQLGHYAMLALANSFGRDSVGHSGESNRQIYKLGKNQDAAARA
jgi:glycosyltransferase involved in cell wall biosynthesis